MKTRSTNAGLLVICLGFCGNAWCQKEPAADGRPITPAGALLIDQTTHLPAVGAMPMAMLGSPDTLGRGGKGRYLLVVNSGYGVQFSEDTSEAQQSIAVIDLSASPEPVVIQNVYFPTPQSANVGLAFSPTARTGGSYEMYVSGGFQNKVWIFRFDPQAAAPIGPGSPGPDTKVTAPFLEISNPGEKSPADYNKGKAALYPAGLAITPDGTTLFVANSDADSVSVIDTSTDQEIERIDVRLAENALPGASPEGIALSADEKTLYVANAHSNAIAVVALSPKARPGHAAGKMKEDAKSKILGLIPTGQYPSAVAVADGKLFVGTGKGTGFEPSSMRVSNSGFTPNPPNAKFPAHEEKNRQGGQYSGSIVSGNISMVSLPEEPALARYTQQTMQNDGLMDFAPPKLFAGQSPITHVIYIIKENRTYDQVFGDVKTSGDGQVADGEPDIAIFGNSDAARRPPGTQQVVTPNHRSEERRVGKEWRARWR